MSKHVLLNMIQILILSEAIDVPVLSIRFLLICIT